MNELPDDFVNLPTPLVGLIGVPSLHFYIEKYISTKSSIDFERIHPQSPAITSSQQHLGSNLSSSPYPNNSSSPSIDALLPVGIQQSFNNSPLPTSLLAATTLNHSNLDSLGHSPAMVSQQMEDLSLNSNTSNSNNNNPPLSPLPTIVTTGASMSPTSTSHTGITIGGGAMSPNGGWRVNHLNVPVLKVTTIEVGGLSNKKEKKLGQSSESYEPQGILKANWIHKNTSSIPSVVTLFIQWPEDKSPKSHEIILSQIDTVKSNIKNRNIKLMIVIVTSATIDTYDEKVTIMRRKADIDPKYFLFVTKTEIKMFTKKWEKLALELSDLYYKEECHTTKSQITKTTHPYLNVRYQFKIAYYSEIRSDFNTSLKYYTFAYNSLMNSLKDLKPTNDPKGIRFAEFRTVASFLNFKISKLSMWLNNITEALQHFDKHIKSFKIYLGPAEKEFTHATWISREYQIFAELLELCPGNTTKTINYNNNPGFYYQVSARYQSIRRDLFKSLSDNYKSSSHASKFKGDLKPRYDLALCTFIGQPPPDVAHPLEGSSGNIMTNDDEVDHDFYRSIAIELHINYTSLIIELYSKAYEQSSLGGNFRILSYIESLIAYEYYISKRYDLSLKYYSKNAFAYRREKWWTLLTHSLSMILKSVHQLNMPTNYVGYAMDYLSPDLSNSYIERSNIQQSLLYILTDSSKLSPPLSLSSPLEVNMEHTHPLLNCRVQFPQSFTFTHSKTEFYVVFESHFPNPIRFSSLKVKFNEKSYNKQISDPIPIESVISPSIQRDAQRDDLVFLPNESRLFTFTLTTKEKMELECQTVTLELGNGNSINFIWNIHEWAIKHDEISEDINSDASLLLSPSLSNNNSSNNSKSNNKNNSSKKKETSKPNPYKKFLERSTIRILDHESLIQIKCNHNSPAIVNEYYEVEIELINNDKDIKKGTVLFEINQQQNHTTIIEKGIYTEANKKSTPLSSLELPAIAEKASFKKKFFIYCSGPDENKLTINVSYETKNGEISHSSKIFNIPVLVGLSPQFHFYNDNFQLCEMYAGGNGETDANGPNVGGTPGSGASVVVGANVGGGVAVGNNTTGSSNSSNTTNTGSIVQKEPLLLMSEIRSTLPYSIVIEKVTLQIASIAESVSLPLSPPPIGQSSDDPNLSMPVAQLLSNSNANISSVDLSKDTNYSVWFNIIPLITGESISLGTLLIEWRRKSGSIVSKLPIPLPHTRITTNPFHTDVVVPSHGVVGEPLSHIIKISNNTNFLQEFDLVVINPPSFGSSDIPFYFSGDRSSSFSVHPESTYEIKHILLPLVAGKHPLPHFKITSKRFNKELAKTQNANFLFIKPNLEWVNK
ncbi:hypothetical protein CYY_001173 [Polysphondylium violaceum]|uniref:Trafficking protein particle complex subunit 11 domain-containing protein n=1 Tax=Polysphondylium violaceum TaxID=133409 RepID=A0A8J4Q1K0_9MYCE|nr:hypothetical protein CYY_001173 [Polysphondylium violaceum]